MLSSSLRAVALKYVHSSRMFSALSGPPSFDGWCRRDHKPGPSTPPEEERRLPANRYGLRTEDYKFMDKEDVIKYAGNYTDLGI